MTRSTIIISLVALTLAATLVTTGLSDLPVADEPTAQQASPALIARGDSIFHGKLGGAICVTCHGANAKGMPGMGPDLTDKVWLHGDGSAKFIATIIRTGVAKPKKSAMAMPPFGGVPLDSAKTAALALYVHSLGAAK